MKPNIEAQWAERIDRELKALPELQAPPTLLARVMSAIERPVLAPWYRRAWQTWPVPLQAGAMLFLVGFLGVLCFGAWELTQSAALASAWHTVTRQFAGVTAMWSAANALVSVGALALKQLSTGVWLAALAAIALAWAACIGLGTIYFRLAFVRR